MSNKDMLITYLMKIIFLILLLGILDKITDII